MRIEEIKNIETIATSIRYFFLEMLNTTLGSQSTKDTCIYATHLLKNAFDQFSDYQTIVRGGDGLSDGGYRDENGELHGHYWLELTTPTSTYIVDITADQFGALPIVVLPIEMNNTYFDGNQQLVEEHMQSLRQDLKNNISARL